MWKSSHSIPLPSRIQTDLNVGAGLIPDRLRTAKGATEDCGCLEALFESYCPLAFIHELAAIDNQTPARSPDAGSLLICAPPAVEMAGRQDQRTLSRVADMFPGRLGAPETAIG